MQMESFQTVIYPLSADFRYSEKEYFGKIKTFPNRKGFYDNIKNIII